VALLRGEIEVASQVVGPDETYQFSDLAAGVYRVIVAGTLVSSEPVTLTGANSVQVNLIAPAENKPLAHYVLFGPAGEPTTRANLLLAQGFLLAFGPSFGFNPEEATGAGMVTIIADTKGVSQQVEAELGLDGTPVQRIAGSVEKVAAALAARVGEGQPFA
jgi:hypothetical protein